MELLQGISAYEAACHFVKDSKDDDPFFILDRSDLQKKVAIWRELMPKITPFYAVKCNNDPEVLKILAGLGLGFDVASKAEIQSVIGLCVDPSRLVFAHTCKIPSHVYFAKTHGISKMTFDNEDELHKIKKIYPEAQLILRVRYDGKSNIILGTKFGADPENCPALLKLAKQLQLNVVGVSFHVGSLVEDGKSFATAITGCRSIIDQARALGFTPSILDIGGGFPLNSGELFNTIANSINQALDQHFSKDDSIEIIAEPGRYISGTALSLVTMITSRHLNKKSNGEIKSAVYYINDGIYGSFMTVIVEKRILPNPKIIRKIHSKENDIESGACFPSVIWGPTCDSYDMVSRRMDLPVLSVGDWLFWPEMGDYTQTLQTNFNSFKNASIKYCINN